MVLVLVNSKVSKFQQDRPDLRDCQVILHQNSHSFLAYDSYVDCTNTHRLSMIEIEDHLLKDITKLKGNISLGEKESIRYAVSMAKTISKREKEWVSTALSD